MELNAEQLANLSKQIKQWGSEMGFSAVGISDIDLSEHEAELQAWLDKGYHGTMSFMANHGMMRARPAELHPGTLSVISVRLDYLPADAQFAKTLKNKDKAYISRYALGRDYHKVLRNKLKQFGKKIEQETELNIGFRPFVDSAPILERELANKAGIGWVGKHTLVLHKEAGSWFFLGELLINLPLPADKPIAAECGSCVACMTICPTQAIVEPYQVDARRCISYLTIELDGPIAEEFRKPMGNRIYGCDDCQLICPWNRYAPLTEEEDFSPRAQLKDQDLLTLFNWSEETFLDKTQGSPIRRIGYQKWLRNLSVGLGNADYNPAIVEAIRQKKAELEKSQAFSTMLDEHFNWSLTQQVEKAERAQAMTKQQQRLIRVIEKGLPRDA
ncbi:tRNA epoxyqueuosine(34) reductase QueG [Catenovulum sp. SM1970]|uniref:tRNA epoxyqueuosine(34) reductase QueG n=1 Tax=Marinifaba aquimaris TaxID=2741323 RepID=UPI001572BE31|nr:tRNA epoxyqueuosine(34) reductase QueG [Marinifaba aquimaris]NTS77467.1 tRNA epoxyqueuosine(34) reductase QueG [Marinifaba aquimaris]